MWRKKGYLQGVDKWPNTIANNREKNVMQFYNNSVIICRSLFLLLFFSTVNMLISHKNKRQNQKRRTQKKEFVINVIYHVGLKICTKKKFISFTLY